MKYYLSILLTHLVFTQSLLGQSFTDIARDSAQKIFNKAHPKGDTITYDTSKAELGYLIHSDSTTGEFWVSRIYRVTISANISKPCYTVFYWKGDNKDSIGTYWHEYGHCDSTSGPCCVPSAIATFEKYRGDSIVNFDCWTSEYVAIKEEYFMPAKSKSWKIGDKYILGPNEHFAYYKKWYPEPHIFICRL